uniref:Putative TRAF-type zinc finger domain-containing protein 1-like n=1 Tax=Davidia involucrata TaxID=16924 RepID=A0A5B7CD99_DAVIN
MAIPSEQQFTNKCSHCDKAIPTQNFDLHIAHCSRNLERCKFCGDMIPKRHAEEHYTNTHAPVTCTLCSETVERETLALHNGENCPQRMVTCEYCEFPLPAVDLFNHQEVCGNRTEYCHSCGKYIRLRERPGHENRCHGRLNDATVGTSRDIVATEREQGAQRRQQQHDFSRKHLLLTVAITGIAVLIGSFVFQKADDQQLQW